MNAPREQPAGGMMQPGGFWRRTFAMLLKEFVQLKRDRVSFAMIVMVPLMQLVMFGYAINTNPRNLPTAVLLQEQSELGRSIIRALGKTKYLRVTHLVEYPWCRARNARKPALDPYLSGRNHAGQDHSLHPGGVHPGVAHHWIGRRAVRRPAPGQRVAACRREHAVHHSQSFHRLHILDA